MKYIIGIDEVGRGALAGPVTVGIVCLPNRARIKNSAIGVLRDSKKLSPMQRERWVTYFKSRADIQYTVARVYPRAIEKINITEAANAAASGAFARLIKRHKIKIENCRIFLDGGLYLGNRNKCEKMRIPVRKSAKKFSKDSRAVSQYSVSTLVRGDEKITAIKIASIIAKVHRDRYMVRLSKIYPAYGFAVHKGYGTKSHLTAIARHGPSSAHRLTFLKKYPTIINTKS